MSIVTFVMLSESWMFADPSKLLRVAKPSSGSKVHTLNATVSQRILIGSAEVLLKKARLQSASKLQFVEAVTMGL